ncbi:hypothetical protein CHC07_03284 [Variovorax sp. B4]|nr:hypothetical protein CHC06_04237 [Variovorax sp. B2]PNG53469.1 hypothetical protein CHC07_03284 [Variovorax sp. B4]
MPPFTLTPPVPPMTPLKTSAAFDSVSMPLPRTTEPVPARLEMVVPPPVPLMSKTPLLVTRLDFWMLPLPLSASVPLVIVVVPL